MKSATVEATLSRARTYASHGSNPQGRKLYSKLLDWPLFISCLVLVIASALMVRNSICSKPSGFSASKAVCYWGELSIQSWLAITGVEFSLLGTYVFPQLFRLGVSKFFTARLERRHTSFAKILNSLTSAPFSTRLRYGNKVIFAIHCLVSGATIVISVMYKFSFVRVNHTGITRIDRALRGYNTFYDVGLSDMHDAYGFAWFSDKPTLSRNILDILGQTNASVRYFERDTNDGVDLIIGPSLNTSVVQRVLNGTIEACLPMRYIRCNVDRDAGWNTGIPWRQPDWRSNVSLPTVREEPYGGGVRITNENDGGLVDLTTDPEGRMITHIATTPVKGVLEFGKYKYSGKVTTQIKYCTGYVSWSNKRTERQYGIINPEDIACEDHAFDLEKWNASQTAGLARKIIDTSIPWNTSHSFGGVLASNALRIIIALNYPSYDRYPKTTENPKPKCLPMEYMKFAVASGIIANNGTGITGVGLGLQCVVLAVAAIGVVLILWPTVPLVSEWPAQWLALTTGIPASSISVAVDATSTGRSHVQGNMTVFWSHPVRHLDDLRLEC